MNIKYEFLTGEIVEIKVPAGISEISIAIDKGIYNSDRRETRRNNSMVGSTFERLMNESKANPFIAANLMPPTRWVIEQLADFYRFPNSLPKSDLRNWGIFLYKRRCPASL